MDKTFKRRANERNVIAYILLGLTVVALFLGIFLIREQIQEMADLTDDSSKKSNDYVYQITVRMSFIIIVFFVCQIFLRLYRYNILKADYYLACSDSINLVKELTPDQKKDFETLLNILRSEKVDLTVPKSPAFSFFPPKNTSTANKGSETTK